MARTLFPWLLALVALGAIGWALNKGQLEPADFTFANGAEVKSFDPAKASGVTENRMINGLFEGLVRWDPETVEPLPAIAERWDVSDDKLTYTFHLRDNAKWSDGSPVTAEDFHYSMRRLLDPRTGGEYAYQAWYVRNARRYTRAGRAVRPGDPVEVELNLPADAINTRRGEVLRGTLVEVLDAAGAPQSAEQLDAAASDEGLDLARWTFVVDIDGQPHRFRYADDVAAENNETAAGERWCRQVLLDFREVGVRVIDPHTIEYRLENPTQFFLTLMGFYPLFPVQRACVEKHGAPHWTYVENLVGNGPFNLQFRQLRDRTRLVRSDTYWDRENVRIDTVDVLAVESTTTGLNLYLTGKVDWIYDVPPPALRKMLAEEPPRDDVNPTVLLNTYFYLLNTTRKPLDDVRVRRALSMALDREEITSKILASGEKPAYSLVAPVLPGYDPPQCAPENVAEAQRLLAEAGYPGGRGFPSLSILFNTHETHQAIAQLIRKQWQRNLGINIRSRNVEFQVLLSDQRRLDYDVSRLSWIGDYADPNTFLDMYVTGGENNRTGWSDPAYDKLINDAARETDPAKRLAIFAAAERMLMDAQPIIPIYFYVSRNMVKPHIRGFYNNIVDTHNMSTIWLDPSGKSPNPFLKGRR